MNKLLIYLDNCCFNRHYDDQEQHKILLGTEAKLKIQQKIKEGEIYLVWSYMLDYENNSNPNEIIRAAISQWKSISRFDINGSEELILKSEKIKASGIDSKDALHIACAIESKADLFITTDIDIIKKGKSIKEVKIINPVQCFIEPDLIEEINDN